MKRREFEHLLAAAAALSAEKEFIIFGSQALLGYMKKPPKELLVSAELDIYPKNRPHVARLIEATLGRKSAFARTYSYHADYVTPELATWPDGWTERMIRYENAGVVAWCVELHDVAVSKLAASRTKDIRYLKDLLRHKLVRVEVLRERIDLLPSASDQQRLHAGLNDLLKEFRREQRSKAVKKPKPARKKS